MADVEVNKWKVIEGYDYPYEVGYDGRIRRPLKNGTWYYLKSYIKKQRGGGSENRFKWIVKLTKNGKGREIAVHQLVADAFLGPCPKGCVPVHINRCKGDNWASNIKYVTKKELGLLYGSLSNRQGVVKIDANGELVDFYSSARNAGKANYMSYQTIIDRCNGKVKSAFAPDGYAYAWEDSEVSMKHAIAKIEKETGYMVKARPVEFDW